MCACVFVCVCVCKLLVYMSVLVCVHECIREKPGLIFLVQSNLRIFICLQCSTKYQRYALLTYMKPVYVNLSGTEESNGVVWWAPRWKLTKQAEVI